MKLILFAFLLSIAVCQQGFGFEKQNFDDKKMPMNQPGFPGPNMNNFQQMPQKPQMNGGMPQMNWGMPQMNFGMPQMNWGMPFGGMNMWNPFMNNYKKGDEKDDKNKGFMPWGQNMGFGMPGLNFGAPFMWGNQMPFGQKNMEKPEDNNERKWNREGNNHEGRRWHNHDNEWQDDEEY